jgi:hypothetical protein
MTRKKLKHVKPEYRGGKIYWYFRRRNGKRTRLPGLFGSTEFMAAYDAALTASSNCPIVDGNRSCRPAQQASTWWRSVGGNTGIVLSTVKIDHPA